MNTQGKVLRVIRKWIEMTAFKKIHVLDIVLISLSWSLICG